MLSMRNLGLVLPKAQAIREYSDKGRICPGTTDAGRFAALYRKSVNIAISSWRMTVQIKSLEIGRVDFTGSCIFIVFDSVSDLSNSSVQYHDE